MGKKASMLARKRFSLRTRKGKGKKTKGEGREGEEKG